MSFEVSEETEALRKTLKQFASKEVIPLEREHGLTWDVPPPKRGPRAEGRRHLLPQWRPSCTRRRAW